MELALDRLSESLELALDRFSECFELALDRLSELLELALDRLSELLELALDRLSPFLERLLDRLWGNLELLLLLLLVDAVEGAVVCFMELFLAECLTGIDGGADCMVAVDFFRARPFGVNTGFTTFRFLLPAPGELASSSDVELTP